MQGVAAASAAPAGSHDPAGPRPASHRFAADEAFRKKCTPPLVDLVERARPADRIFIWIFLADHGPAIDGGRAAASACLSPRAASRRELRGAAPLDRHDLPASAAYVDSLRPSVLRLRHESRYFNAVSAEVEAGAIPAICEKRFVRSVDRVASFRREALPDELEGEPLAGRAGPLDRGSDRYGGSFLQLDLVGVIDLLESGVNGSGGASGRTVLIALLDTGFRLDHAALGDVHVEAQYDFVQGDTVVSNQPGDAPTQDVHGTTVLGVIAGHAGGSLIGPAWGASFLLAKTEIVNLEIQVEEDTWVAGIEWADRLGADVVSSSLGYSDWYTRDQLNGNTAKTTIAADIAVSHGIVVVNSAGNRDGAGLVAPADGDSVLAIGAVDRYGAIAPFSSRGPTADGRIKPDFVAMGMGVESVSSSDLSGYALYNGTSFAAPMVAGLCALLLETHPDWNPVQVREALRATSSRSGFPDNIYGYGIPDAALASRYPESFATTGAFPNPFAVETRMQFSSTRPGRVRAHVYDCRGALVKTLVAGEAVEGRWTLLWDGTSDGGEQVGSGVYFIRVDGGGLDKTFKVVHVR